MSKLTKPQAETLKEVARLTDLVGGANAYGHRLNKGTLERLEKRGLIHSAKPFAGSYHKVTLTDAGRAELEQVSS